MQMLRRAKGFDLFPDIRQETAVASTDRYQRALVFT